MTYTHYTSLNYFTPAIGSTFIYRQTRRQARTPADSICIWQYIRMSRPLAMHNSKYTAITKSTLQLLVTGSKCCPQVNFLARDSMLSALYAIANPSVCPSVCPSVRPSVTRVDQSKTVERIIEILSPSDRPNILVCRHQRSLRKSDGFTPNGGAKYKGGSKN